jgi:hypothetical protein
VKTIDLFRYCRTLAPRVDISIEQQSDQIREIILESLSPTGSAEESLAKAGVIRIRVHAIVGGRLFTNACGGLVRMLIDPETQEFRLEMLTKLIRVNLIQLRWTIGKETDDTQVIAELDRLIDVLATPEGLSQSIDAWKKESSPEVE